MSSPSNWLARAKESLEQLAGQPWTLFLLLLSVNTLAQPYGGITHDARLYSVQVLNRVEQGTYDDDLYFRYGSQDEYSLFSRLAAPLVYWLGLPTAFFLIYLLSKSLLLWGMIRVTQTLIPDRLASTLALMYCMAILIHFGGHHILKLQENFVTPRMSACGLVLLGLDLLLRNRPLFSFAAILFALGVHPLMAFGGLLIWIGYHLWKYCGGKIFIAANVAVGVLAGFVLADETTGKRCFGTMDDVWRRAILNASSFNFPSQWAPENWQYLAFQLVILGIAIWKYRWLDIEKVRFLTVLLLVSLVGTVGTVLAEQLPYALLLQGQPYRVLWILAFLHYPLLCWLCLDWSRQPDWTSQLASCVLLGVLCSSDGLRQELMLPLFLMPLLMVALRGLEKEPARADWLSLSVRLSLVIGAILWSGHKLILLVDGYDELCLRYPEQREIVNLFLITVGPVVFLAGTCAVLVWLTPMRWNRPVSTWLLAAGCVFVQAFVFAFPETEFYQYHGTLYRADLRSARKIIHQDRSPSSSLPTVYCNLGCLDYVWLDLHAQCYFDWWQAGNFMFRREMAEEGQRRACLVGPFEIDRYRKIEHQLNEGSKETVERFFQARFDRGPTTLNDLARLCREPNLDYLLLEQYIAGVPSTPVGRLYLYSCKEVRDSDANKKKNHLPG